MHSSPQLSHGKSVVFCLELSRIWFFSHSKGWVSSPGLSLPVATRVLQDLSMLLSPQSPQDPPHPRCPPHKASRTSTRHPGLSLSCHLPHHHHPHQTEDSETVSKQPLNLGVEGLTPICPTRVLSQSREVRGEIKCLPCPSWRMWLTCPHQPASRSHTPQVGASHPGQAVWSTTVSSDSRAQAIIINIAIALHQ